MVSLGAVQCCALALLCCLPVHRNFVALRACVHALSARKLFYLFSSFHSKGKASCSQTGRPLADDASPSTTTSTASTSDHSLLHPLPLSNSHILQLCTTQGSFSPFSSFATRQRGLEKRESARYFRLVFLLLTLYYYHYICQHTAFGGHQSSARQRRKQVFLSSKSRRSIGQTKRGSGTGLDTRDTPRRAATIQG